MLHGILSWGYRESIKEAVAFRNRFIRSGRIDPWDSSDENVRLYKPAFESIAQSISGLSQETIRTRFNLETGKIELFGEVTREIIAIVELCIEDGCSRAIVEYPQTLHPMPDNLKALFIDALLMRVEFR